MPEVVKSICDVLSTIIGIETESTTEGLDAVFMVKQKMENKQMYHLILSDLTMPYDGYEIAHDIRQLEKTNKTQPTYKIYGLSSDAQNPIVELKSAKAGLDGVLLKPLSLRLIREVINKRITELKLKMSIGDTPA